MPETEFPDRYWFIPKGAKTIFSAQEIQPEIKDGVLYLGSENPIKLQKCRAKGSAGIVRFTALDGEKNKRGPFLYLYNPKMNLLSYWFAIFAGGKSKRLAETINGFSELDA